jgi:hypothetical protein
MNAVLSRVEAVVHVGEGLEVELGEGLGEATEIVSVDVSVHLPPLLWQSVLAGVRIAAVTVSVPVPVVVVVMVTVALPEASVVALSDEDVPVPAVPPWMLPGPVSVNVMPTPAAGVPLVSVTVAVRIFDVPLVTVAVSGVRSIDFACAAATVFVAVAVSRGSLLSMPAVGLAGVVRARVWSTQTVTVSVPDLVPW